MGVIKWLKEWNKDVSLTRSQVFKYYLFCFLAASFAGWVYEEIFYYFEDGYLYNRGFFYGPWLPVYGFGAVLMVLLLRRFKKNPLVFFVSAMLVTGVLEYFTGLAMWQLFHYRWWDYTPDFCNIGGFVCLRSVTTFAIGGLVLIYGLDPFLRRFVQSLSAKSANVVCAVFACLWAVDIICTFTLPHVPG